MQISLAQINPIVGDLEGNREKILRAIREAEAREDDLIVFPELSLTGYPPEDLLLYPYFIEKTAFYLETIAREVRSISAVVGFPRKNSEGGEKSLFNSAALIQNGKIVGYYDKILLPTYDVFDERRYFQPGKHVPIWEIKGKKVAITICEDIWGSSDWLRYANYDDNPLLKLLLKKPDVVVNLSSSPYSLNKPNIRLDVVKNAAKSIRAPLYLCNQVGGNDCLIFDGNSLVVDSEGNLLAQGKGFEEDTVIVGTSTTSAPLNPQEDLYQALVLGVKDYFGKQGFSKALIGVSGGVDSALVASIAVDALGKENVMALCMPSEFTTEASIVDARELTENLGIRTEWISIEKPYKTFLEILHPSFKSLPYDTTEENIQARIRGMLLMAFSNKFGSIVLSTGNKSEMAMGYTTLYGDMCGGLGVLSDVTKRQVYQLCHLVNQGEMRIPKNIIIKPPSAELRPNQTDRDSLPDYDVVDSVLEDYIIDHLSPEEIASKHEFPIDLVQDLILKIHRNEYKRRQGPPGLRVSDRSFSIGRRFH